MPGDAVNLVERQVLVLERVVVAVLQLRQQLRGGGGRGDLGAHRHRVDQQAHHLFGVVDLELADPRARGTEDDVVPAGQRGQHHRPGRLQHGAQRGVAGACQLAQRPGGLLRDTRLFEAAAALPQPALRGDQGGRVETGQHLAPGPAGGVEVALGQPGEEGPVGAGGGQPLPVVAGEDLAQQDRQRPAVEQDVVAGQHEPVPVASGAHQRGAEYRLAGQIGHRGAFGGAQLLDQVVGIGRARTVELDVAPLDGGVGGDDLHRFVVLVAEQGRQVGMPVDDGAHRLAQPVGVEGAGEGEIQLHRVHVVHAVVALRGAGVEEQSLLQRGQRQDVGDAVPALQLVDLLLGQPGRGDVRRGETAAAAGAHVRADTGQRLEPQPAHPGDLLRAENRRRPSPFGVQVRAGAGVDGAGVELDGVHQRHGHRRGGAEQRHVLADPPPVGRRIRRGALASQVVERDRRVGPGQVDVGVEVTQQPVGQRFRQGAQLLLGPFEDGAQRRVAGGHLRPAQPGDVQRHRVFGGEPADGAGQVDIRAEFLVAAVALHVDADRSAGLAQEFRPSQAERDQQDVVDAGVERRRHLTEQHRGRLGVQLHRQATGAGVGVHVGSRCRQRGRCGGDRLPAVELADYLGVACVLVEQSGPPGERRARRRQLHRLAGAVQGPGNVEVLQQDPPRHRVHGQVVDDHRQLAGGLHPQRGEHRPGGRVQPRPGRQQRLVGQRVHRPQAVAGLHRPGLGHLERPAVGAVVGDPQPQHGVPIYQRLQHDCDLGLGHTRGRLHQDGLVELVSGPAGPFGGLQPPHDRGGRHGADALVGHLGRPVAGADHPGQPGDGLLDENVSRPASQPGGTGAGHHLQRRDAVAAEVEEGVVDADPFDTEHMGVDAGHGLLDGVGRRPVAAARVFGCG
ncbi:hypothetical protein PICSAR49_00009 [Mycobacterium avium subsp. paratuberculosis]|nr:hypothetical protein PICSAR103_00197 [Mycobacterium avium subsp. paratuberculosis]CAG6852947.1 hypothetical protein PICSAR100_00199 [Mycobacterium avium subsp. paratuberculosis]CAG6875980.1 hypothetical protein PICSAR118_01433 [Mycobacterium avium subsp. paratuberculosis]CAG6926866.1 hypothetical protein PICSAR10_03908 [Mycobacterium avium subsp. paratuberculosis]CAG6927995.1 hypothetical protein PICSAR104_03977 [Mycobacterium avium subsp. paratuberculosis]